MPLYVYRRPHDVNNLRAKQWPAPVITIAAGAGSADGTSDATAVGAGLNIVSGAGTAAGSCIATGFAQRTAPAVNAGAGAAGRISTTVRSVSGGGAGAFQVLTHVIEGSADDSTLDVTLSGNVDPPWELASGFPITLLDGSTYIKTRVWTRFQGTTTTSVDITSSTSRFANAHLSYYLTCGGLAGVQTATGTGTTTTAPSVTPTYGTTAVQFIHVGATYTGGTLSAPTNFAELSDFSGRIYVAQRSGSSGVKNTPSGDTSFTNPNSSGQPWLGIHVALKPLLLDPNIVGSAAGTSTVAGVYVDLGYSGTAAGTSTVSGTGASTFAGVGSVAGTSTVTAAPIIGVPGSASGTGAATGAGTGVITAGGSAAGTSAVSATGEAGLGSPGTAAGICTVSAGGASTFAAAGSSAGTSTATAVSPDEFHVEFVADSHTVYGARTQYITIDVPAGAEIGDLLIMVAAIGSTVGETQEYVAPSGWSMLSPGFPSFVQDLASFRLTTSIWYRLAAGSEPSSYTLEYQAGAVSLPSEGMILAYRGAVIDDFTINTGSGATASITGLTADVDNTTFVYIAHDWSATGGRTPPSGSTPTWTEREDASGGLFYVADGELDNGQSTGNDTLGLTQGSNDQWSTFLLALVPSGLAEGGTNGLAAGTSTAAAIALPLYDSVQYVSHTHGAYNDRGNLSLSKPTGTTYGDLMLAFVSRTDSIGDEEFLAWDTVPSGWNLFTPDIPVDIVGSGGYTVRTWAYWKIAGISEPDTYSWNVSTFRPSEAIIATYRGAKDEAPEFTLNSSTLSGNSTTSTAFGITPSVANTRLVFFSTNWSGSVRSAPGGSDPTYTERVDDSGSLMYLADGELDSGIASGNETHDNSNGVSQPWNALLVALKPSASVEGYVGTAAGVATASAVGAAVYAAAGAASGTSTVTAVGASTAAAAGSSAGTSTATALPIIAVAASAAGTSTASAVGTSTAASAGICNGTSTVAAVGASTHAGTGSAAGTCTVAATGASTFAAAGTSTGTSTAAATAVSTFAAAGSSAGTSTVTATGIGGVVGAAAGTSTVSAVGASTHAATGTVAGTSTVSAVGASTAAAAGTATGTSTVTAVSIGGVIGTAAGTSTVTGVGAATSAAVGAASGTSTATAAATQSTTGTSAGTSTATAVGASTYAAAGSAAGTSTVAAVATQSATGTADGVADADAVGASTHAAAGSSTSTAQVFAFTGNLIGRNGVADGTSTAAAVGASTAEAVGDADGAAEVLGTLRSTAETAGVSQGVASVTGVLRADFVATGSSTGASTVTAESAAGSSGAGISTGASTATAQGASTAAATGSAAGTSTAVSSTNNTFSSVGEASGVASATGVSLATARAEGAASGAATATATAIAGVRGTAAGASTVTGVLAASAVTTGSATGTSAANGYTGATAPGDGVAAGTSTATATGLALGRGAGAASGAAICNGVGASTHKAVGSAAGVGTGSAATIVIRTAAGAASSTGTVTGILAATAAIAGTAGGHADVLADILALKITTGLADCYSEADAPVVNATEGYIFAVGLAAGTSTAHAHIRALKEKQIKESLARVPSYELLAKTGSDGSLINITSEHFLVKRHESEFLEQRSVDERLKHKK